MVSFPFLSVCPIQFHFRLLTCMDISVSSVLLQSSSFEITSGQWMFKIFRRQRLTKVCSFVVVVLTTFHVSDPYNSNDLTLLRKMRSLVLVDILLFLHTGYSCTKAPFAFWIRYETSCVAPPCSCGKTNALRLRLPSCEIWGYPNQQYSKYVFRRLGKSVYSSASIISARPRRTFIKSEFWQFFENLSRKFKFR